MTYRIHTLIDPGTGEIVPFRPDLLPQIAEVQRAIELLRVRIQAERQIRIYVGEEPKLAVSGEELARALFERP